MSLLNPSTVPRGARTAVGAKKRHKAKPKVGRGNYVKAPLVRDKVTQPRWVANAVVNNPLNVLAGTAVAGGVGLTAADKKKISKRDKNKDVAAGALVGGGTGHFARVGADYQSKAISERQMKSVSTKGNYGPYKEGPHKKTLNAYKREANKAGAGDVRSKAKYFDENFPKGVPSYRARKVGLALNKKPVVAGAILGGAAIGGTHQKVRKSSTFSAFGVDHG